MTHTQLPAQEFSCTNATSSLSMRARTHEAGFTLMELLIVVIIIAILVAIAIPTFFGSKDSTRQNGVKTVAGAYSQGVAAYMLDHGNQLPTTLTPAKTGGLVDPDGKPYVTMDPTVKDGHVAITGAGTSKTYGRLAYTHSGLNYEIKVYFRKTSKPWQVVCSYGVPSGGAKRC